MTIASAGTVRGDGHGIYAHTGAANGNIAIAISGDVFGNSFGTGFQGAGIRASAYNGNVSVTGTAGADVSGRSGVDVSSKNGNVLVGLIGNVTGTADDGIDARSTTAGTVAVSFGSGTVSAAGDGIYAMTGGSGNVTVTTGLGSLITAGGDGVEARSNGGAVLVQANGNIGATHYGIFAQTSAGGTNSLVIGGNVTSSNESGVRLDANAFSTLTIAAAGSVKGLGTGSSAVIDARTGNAADTTVINNAGTIKSTTAGAAAFDDLAILERGPGKIVLNNSGRLEGVVDFSAAASATINNTSTTSWHVTGTSTLSPGADTLTNSGLMATNSGGVATVIAFGNGSDTFNNSGTLVVGEPLQGAAVLTLTSLQTLNNSGSIYLGAAGAAPLAALPSGTDGFTNDQLVATGASFVGSGNSALFLDAFLGAGGTADKLIASALSGSTTINVHDTNSGAGAFNQILVVDGTSSTTTAFKLPGTGKINKGLVDYVLQRNGADWYLAGVAAARITNVTTINSQITSNGWQVTVTLTQKSGRRFAPGAVRDGAFWVNGLASADGESFAEMSRFYGLAFGADFGAKLGGGSDLLFGVFGGYGNPLPRQLDGNAITQTQNWQTGAYVSRGAGFADVMLKGEAIDGGVRVQDAGYSVLKGNSFAAEANAGYRFTAGSWYFEPVASLTSRNAQLDTLHVLGGAIAFGNAPHVDTGLTARFGGAWSAGDVTLRPYAMAAMWHALSGTSGATLISGGTALRVDDPLAQNWTAFGAGLDLVRAGGLSAFLSGTQVTGEGRERSEVRAGLRWMFGG
jgi:outer membrane autotransporter protein